MFQLKYRTYKILWHTFNTQVHLNMEGIHLIWLLKKKKCEESMILTLYI